MRCVEEHRSLDGSRGSFGAFLMLVALAEAAFALLVGLILGTPPAPVATVIFGIGMAGALALQRRWSAAPSRTPRDRPWRPHP